MRYVRRFGFAGEAMAKHAQQPKTEPEQLRILTDALRLIVRQTEGAGAFSQAAVDHVTARTALLACGIPLDPPAPDEAP